MGKFQSKHECFFINPALNQALKDEIWKTKSGLNLANYNMDETLSELSLCFEEKSDSPPLRVDLPPPKLETDTSKVLKLDHMRVGGKEDKENKTKNNFNIEEFECGVQFEGSESSKQEWFFTLYNFDGHGRITKEDLASLLKALYDAVGSSIQLPPNGARTLKLRLSVGQEQTTKMKNSANLKANNPDAAKDKTNHGRNAKEFSKMNNLTRTNVKCSTEHKHLFKSMSLNTDAVTTPAKEERLTGEARTPEARTPPLNTVVENAATGKDAQESLSKSLNKHIRRHHGDKRHKRRHRHSSTPHCPVAPACLVSAKLDSVGITTFKDSGVKVTHNDLPAARECEDRRNYYLDLAGVENTCSRLHNNFTSCSAPKPGFLSSLMGVASRHRHHRSRSYDITKCVDCSKTDSKPEAVASCRCDNAKDSGKDKLRTKCNKLKLEHQHLRSKSSDSHDASHRNAGTKDQPGHTHAGGGVNSHANRHSSYMMAGGFPSSPLGHHHRRHRHKEKDQEMAMQQVAQWIEREHLWDLTGEGSLPVQRHEHHHIHEHHHHHHYHHYYET